MLTRSREPSTSSTATVTFDATPIPTPTDITPLPVGTFSMPLMTSRVLSACFSDTTLSQSWQCHLVISGLRLTIAKTKADSLGDYTAAITCNTTNTLRNHVYSYGEQPFLIEEPASLELVSDTYDPGRGPAWFKMLAYNKTVIVPEGVLKPDGSPPENRIRLRNGGGKYPMGSADFKRKGIISEGAKPWICTWPQTYLELFIYVNQNSSFASVKPPPPPPPPPPPSQTPSPGPPPPPPPPGWTETGGTKYTAAAAANPTNNWGDGYPEGSKPTEAPSNTAGTSSSATTEPPSSSSGFYGPIDANDNFTPPPPLYPRVIKLEERHMYGQPRPTCTQVEIQDSGKPAKPLKGSDGKPIVIEIMESEPSPQDALNSDLGRRSSPLDYRDASSNSANQCGCVWFFT